MRRTRVLPLLALALAACADATYAYSFDLTDPGAKNLTRPGERDVLEDADVRSELLVDPTSFQAILLDLTNKTDADLYVAWDQIAVVGPDGMQTPLHPDTQLGAVQPGAKVVARLITFQLPATGKLAAAYDGAKFELVVPMTVRGAQRELRYHFLAHTNKL